MKDIQYKILQENFKTFLYQENKVQVPTFLFHIVKAADEEVIKKQGLVANNKIRTDTKYGRIYLSETLTSAKQQYKKLLQTDPTYKNAVCFKIDKSKLKDVILYRDIENNDIYTNDSIPKEAIVSVIRFCSK